MTPLEEQTKKWAETFADAFDQEEALLRFLDGMGSLTPARAGVLALDVYQLLVSEDEDRAHTALAWANHSQRVPVAQSVQYWCEQFLDSADLRDSVGEFLDSLDRYSPPAAAVVAWGVYAQLQEEDPDLAAAVLGWARRAWKGPAAPSGTAPANIISFRPS